MWKDLIVRLSAMRTPSVRLLWAVVRILYEILCDQHTYYLCVFEEAMEIENLKQARQTMKFFSDAMALKRELKNTSSCKNILKSFMLLGIYVSQSIMYITKRIRDFSNLQNLLFIQKFTYL